MAKKKAGKGEGKGKRSTKRTPAARGGAKTKKPARKVARPIAKPAAPKPIARAPLRRRIPGARPAPHKAPALPGNIYERDLDKTPANYATLTPLQFLERTASVYPERLALVHGPRRQTWAETYARCRKLASALEKAGIDKGDTVTIMAPNIPEMDEAHFDVPMSGAGLNCLNTRLDAAMLAFILDHSETKLLQLDRDYNHVITEALPIANVH